MNNYELGCGTQYCPSASGLARSLGTVQVDHEGIGMRRRLLTVVCQDSRGILLRRLDSILPQKNKANLNSLLYINITLKVFTLAYHTSMVVRIENDFIVSM